MSQPYHSKYIDPFSDTGFKVIFGREGYSEDVLRQFLNEVFRGQPMFESIKEVKFVNNERSRDRAGGKTIIHDVMCTTEQGHRFIVEMQSSYQRQFLVRAIYYVSRGVTDQSIQLSGGREWTYDFMPVVGTFITKFNVPGLPRKVLTHIGLADVDSGELIENHIRFAFIQTSFFDKTQDECVSEFDKIIYIMKNMQSLNDIPFKTNETDIYSQMDELAQYANLSPEDRRIYDYELKQSRDRACELESAYYSGRQQQTLQIAANMKTMGMSFDSIAKATGLTEEEIEKL